MVNSRPAFPGVDAIDGSGLFPAMDADLTLAKLGPRITQLSFSGSYEPPLRSLGLALDRMLHRVAEATVKRTTSTRDGPTTA